MKQLKNISILNSAYFSLYLQFIIGIICFFVIFIPLHTKDIILSYILILETIVQFIEFLFYYWLITHFSSINYEVTFVRYFDWFITTPTMLISIIFFMIYKHDDETNKNDTVVDISNIFDTYGNLIGYILLFNALMLIFGFLGEIKILNKYLSFFIGFIFFFLSYYLIYDNFVQNNYTNLVIFYVNFIIWSLYGVAYLFSYKLKNISYNLLDIFSKNMNGLLLSFYILYLYYNG